MTSDTPVKQLDHLIVRVDDPAPLFKLLSETLQLPIAWPLRAYPSFTSGGITLGNLYLELLSCGTHSTDARFVAIAFEAESLEDSVRELKHRQVPHGPIVPYVEVGPDGKKTKLYSNVILGKVLGSSFWIDTMIRMGRLPGSSAMANPGSGGAMVKWGMDKVMRGNLVFLVEYAYGEFKDLPHWSEFEGHDEKRAADRATLAARDGGSLGLLNVKEIVAGVKDVEEARKRWRDFLGPKAEASPEIIEIADGPGVRLVRADKNGIQSLVLNVSSLKRAEAFVAQSGMLGDVNDNQLRIAPEKFHGLDVRLVES
jgi:hypothetical protein